MDTELELDEEGVTTSDFGVVSLLKSFGLSSRVSAKSALKVTPLSC